jgi:exosortase/archaeosortase family protein
MNNKASSVYTRWNKIRSKPYGFVCEIALFVAITYGFHLFYRAYSSTIKASGIMISLNDFFIQTAFYQVQWIFRSILNLSFTAEPHNVLRFVNQEAIAINTDCSGTKQFLQVLVLFILYPGPWIKKTWFILTALLAIHVVNVLRISMLGFWRAESWPYWQWFHDWPMRVVFYLVIFGFWYWWNEKLSRPAPNPKSVITPE